MNDWRDIPGYNGDYQISREGEIRSWRYKGERRRKMPWLMHPYARYTSSRPNSRRRFVTLYDQDGKGHAIPVLRIMCDTWLGGCPEGKVPYHKNGDLADHNINNIGFTTKQELGKMTGAKASRRPVLRVDRSGEVVAVYPSARAAARANFLSYQSVIDRCNGKVKRPYALDGHTYRYDH